MNATEQNLAVARGEALAAQLMASAALQATLMFLPGDRLDALSRISAFLNDTLNASGPGKPDPQFDELNTRMREVARFHVEQTLQNIEDTLRRMPNPGDEPRR